MNILFLSSWYPSKLDNELGNFVQRHAEAVRHTGIRVMAVHIAVSHYFIYPKVEKETVEGIEILHYFLPKMASKNRFLTRYYARKITKGLQQNRFYPEVLHCHVAFPSGCFAIEIADELKIPMVYTEHWSGLDPERKMSRVSEAVNQMKRVATRSSFLMPVSEYLSNLMREKGLHGEYRVVNNAVNTEYFYPLRRMRNDQFRFLHISSFDLGIKNTEGILKAFSRIENTDCELIIAGDGDLDRLKRYCKTEKIDTRHIRFRGKMTYREVAKLNQACDCFVLFSQFEMLPCVIVEALCCGLPIISTRVGGVVEIVDKTNGITVARGNIPALTAAMVQLVKTASHYDKSVISSSAQKRFSYATIGNQFSEIYRSTIDGSIHTD